MAQDIPLTSLDHLYWFCPLPSPCASSAPTASNTVQETEMSLALYSNAQQQLECLYVNSTVLY